MAVNLHYMRNTNTLINKGLQKQNMTKEPFQSVTLMSVPTLWGQFSLVKKITLISILTKCEKKCIIKKQIMQQDAIRRNVGSLACYQIFLSRSCGGRIVGCQNANLYIENYRCCFTKVQRHLSNPSFSSSIVTLCLQIDENPRCF